jgi:hypothetical protein
VAYRFKPSTSDLREIEADADIPAKEEEEEPVIDFNEPETSNDEGAAYNESASSNEEVMTFNEPEPTSEENEELSRDDIINAAVNDVLLGTKEDEDIPEEPEYIFPPVHLLKKAPPDLLASRSRTPPQKLLNWEKLL